MSQFMHGVRFVAGMALLAGGAVLVHPVADGLIARQPSPTADAAPSAPAAAVGPMPAAVPGLPGFDAAAGTDPSLGVAPPPVPPLPPAGADPVHDAVPAAYVPPPVPAPLPRSDLMAGAPDLAVAYRSTVEIPPPPLLDTQTPPPPVIAAARGPWAAAGSPALPAQPPVPHAAPEVWGTRTVRDGDDLTSIALEVYGHAAAASAILDANAAAIPDPQLLPIGLALRLPPSWTLPASPASRAAGPPAIEPVKGTGQGAGQGAGPRAAVATGPGSPSAAHWLALPPPAAAPPTVATPPASPATPGPTSGPSPLAERAARPAAVRAAAGDTLDTIAERFYGDRGMARRIWLANRDRLRDPALVVPGMELKLP